ncbi:unnamed protein product, partial [Owenia fusiformis]
YDICRTVSNETLTPFWQGHCLGKEIWHKTTNMFALARLRTAATNLRPKVCNGQTRNMSLYPWRYRVLSTPPSSVTMLKAEMIGGFFWFWVLYHCYKQPEHIVGHWDYPDPSKWTDKELGIPPDEEDP